jgi:hypothetical protein
MSTCQGLLGHGLWGPHKTRLGPTRGFSSPFVTRGLFVVVNILTQNF